MPCPSADEVVGPMSSGTTGDAAYDVMDISDLGKQVQGTKTAFVADNTKCI